MRFVTNWHIRNVSCTLLLPVHTNQYTHWNTTWVHLMVCLRSCFAATHWTPHMILHDTHTRPNEHYPCHSKTAGVLCSLDIWWNRMSSSTRVTRKLHCGHDGLSTSSWLLLHVTLSKDKYIINTSKMLPLFLVHFSSTMYQSFCGKSLIFSKLGDDMTCTEV